MSVSDDASLRGLSGCTRLGDPISESDMSEMVTVELEMLDTSLSLVAEPWYAVSRFTCPLEPAGGNTPLKLWKLCEPIDSMVDGGTREFGAVEGREYEDDSDV